MITSLGMGTSLGRYIQFLCVSVCFQRIISVDVESGKNQIWPWLTNCRPKQWTVNMGILGRDKWLNMSFKNANMRFCDFKKRHISWNSYLGDCK